MVQQYIPPSLLLKREATDSPSAHTDLPSLFEPNSFYRGYPTIHRAPSIANKGHVGVAYYQLHS